MNIDRAKQVLQMLVDLPDEQFNMNFFWDTCQTIGCLAGHTVHALIPKEEWKISTSNGINEINYSLTFANWFGNGAASLMFNSSYDDYPVTKQMVIDKLQAMIVKELTNVQTI